MSSFRRGNIPENFTTAAPSAAHGDDSREERRATAENLPFVLRAWWLRQFEEYKGLIWREEAAITGPLWSAYSDPGCDMGGMDYSYELEDD